MNVKLRNGLIAFIIFAGFVLCLWGVNYPFVGIYNTNNNYLSLAAKNYQRFGFVNLKFFPTYFAGEHFMPNDPYYLHHPVLIFLLSAVPMILFHFQNWSVHAVNFVFITADIWMMFLIAKFLWGRNVAVWAAASAAVFPMLTFFWKYIFFEQASLFFNLSVFYFLIRYLKENRNKYLYALFGMTLLSGFTDWGVLYPLFPLLLFFRTKFGNRFTKPFVIYLAASAISLGLFIASVFILQGGFKELGAAIWGRSYTSELTGLSFWPLRLIIITVLRMILYFTPLSVMAVWTMYKKLKERRTLPELTLLFFFLYGILNLLFLPAASWGHSYFLFYFIPFFAFAGGIYLERVQNKKRVLYSWLIVVMLTSISVNYLKLEQVKKQLWKYDAAVQISAVLKPYETVGVVNFAGDIFENYFLHPSQPIPYDKLNDWLRGVIFPGVTRTVYVCAGPCTFSELSTAQSLKTATLVTTYSIGTNEAWLITKRLHAPVPIDQKNQQISGNTETEGGAVIKTYRAVRDWLGVGQI